MEKIIDSVLSINTNKTKETKVSTTFIYNKYSFDETRTDDTIIVSRKRKSVNDIKNKYIILNLQNSFDDKDLKEFKESIPELEFLSSKEKLNDSEVLLFNKQTSFNHERNYFISNLNNDDIEDYINYHISTNVSTSNLDIASIKRNISDSYKISTIKSDNLNLKLLNENLEINSKNLFLENSLPDMENNFSQKDYIHEGYLFNTLNYFKQTINTETTFNFANKSGVRCGILLTKYKKINDNFVKISTKFISKKKDEEDLKNIPFSFEDENIQYGQTYKYEISDVYLYLAPDKSNRFVLNYYLLCDSSFITEDVVCRENIPPPPPSHLKFSFNEKENILQINWDEPTNYQYDAKGYQIFKRNSLDEPFELVHFLDGHSEYDDFLFDEHIIPSRVTKTEGVSYSYNDKEYESGRITIYALRTVDAHGFVSDYSEQIALLYDPFEEKLILDSVSPSGAPRDYPNQKVRHNSLFFKNDISIISNVIKLKKPNKLHFFITPEYVRCIDKLGKERKIIDNEYQITLTKLNNMSVHKEKFVITNFNLNQELI